MPGVIISAALAAMRRLLSGAISVRALSVPSAWDTGSAPPYTRWQSPAAASSRRSRADAVLRQSEFGGQVPGDELAVAAQPCHQQVPALGS